MARDVYSLRIFATGGLTNAAGLVGPVVPAGFVYVLRDIDVVEISGTAPAIMQVESPVVAPLWNATRTVTGGVVNAAWRGRQVYAEGEQVGFFAFSGTWAICASGYQLTLP